MKLKFDSHDERSKVINENEQIIQNTNGSDFNNSSFVHLLVCGASE